MIINLKVLNEKSILEELEPQVLPFYKDWEKEALHILILNGINYLELHLNCSLRLMEVEFQTENLSSVLPLWPIRKINKVINLNREEELKFNLSSNEIVIDGGEKNQKSFEKYKIIYQVGYPLSLLKHHIPFNIFLGAIEENYKKNSTNTFTKDMERAIIQLREIYGKGDD